MVIIQLMASALCALLFPHVVVRSRLCLDFAVTLHFVHFLIVCLSNRSFPSQFSWFVRHLFPPPHLIYPILQFPHFQVAFAGVKCVLLHNSCWMVLFAQRIRRNSVGTKPSEYFTGNWHIKSDWRIKRCGLRTENILLERANLLLLFLLPKGVTDPNLYLP